MGNRLSSEINRDLQYAIKDTDLKKMPQKKVHTENLIFHPNKETCNEKQRSPCWNINLR